MAAFPNRSETKRNITQYHKYKSINMIPTTIIF
jgi:hypothetical protein